MNDDTLPRPVPRTSTQGAITPANRVLSMLFAPPLYAAIDQEPGLGGPTPVALDVGCGAGTLTVGLVDRGYDAIGLDNDWQAVSQASRDRPDIMYVVGDAHALPFRDHCVDLLILVGVLQYLDRSAVLHECQRALIPRAVAVIVENLRDNPFVLSYRLLRRLAWRWPKHPLLSRFSHDARPVAHLAWSRRKVFDRYFSETRYSAYHLTTPLGLVYALLGGRWAEAGQSLEALFKLLTRLDQLILRSHPALARFCWIAVIQCRK